MAREILVVPHNHFDPMWRRCFTRPARYKGVIVRSYAEVEEKCIDAWLALANKGYTYYEGQAAVWRQYLKRHPGRLRRLQTEMKRGRLLLMLAGEVVQDSVLPTAEGLVRNFLTAWPFYCSFAGEDHPGLRLATLEDAFGNSPNYPQVLKGVGAEAACFLSYRPLAEDIWVGIDGTKLPCLDRHPREFCGGFQKNPPCPACAGKGCLACGQSGILLVDGFDLASVRAALERAHKRREPWVEVALGSEEIVPDHRVANLLAALKRRGWRTRFATPLEVWRLLRPRLLRALTRRGRAPSADLNPAMPGCMVSRIRCKQRTRAISYHLLAAEAALATAAWRKGICCKPPTTLSQAWRHIAFSQFHDAITGTHIDSAHRELMDKLDAAERIAHRLLPLHEPQPKLGRLRPLRNGRRTLRWGELEITFDRCGIIAIRRRGRDLFGAVPPLNNRRRPWRIAELILETDFGDAWGKRIAPCASCEDDMSCIPLGDYNETVSYSARAIRWQGRYRGGDPKIKRLAWTVTALPSDDRRLIHFLTAVDWDTGSRRLRVVVPVRAHDSAAVYEVPFGFLERRFDAQKLNFSQWAADTQEFPTLHWVHKAIDRHCGVVIFNRGLPCNRWLPSSRPGTPGRLDISLLRSPEYEFCANESASYEFWDLAGQRDAGKHLFAYALMPYYQGITAADLVRRGYDYNLPAPIEPPFAIQGDVIATAWKLAEDGKGWILRLQEISGQGADFSIDFQRECTVVPTDLLERPRAQPQRLQRLKDRLHKHGILTLRLV